MFILRLCRREFKPVSVFLKGLKTILDADKGQIIVGLEFVKIIKTKRYGPVEVYIGFIDLLGQGIGTGEVEMQGDVIGADLKSFLEILNGAIEIKLLVFLDAVVLVRIL